MCVQAFVGNGAKLPVGACAAPLLLRPPPVPGAALRKLSCGVSDGTRAWTAGPRNGAAPVCSVSMAQVSPTHFNIAPGVVRVL